jgi:hypothetical protein
MSDPAAIIDLQPAEAVRPPEWYRIRPPTADELPGVYKAWADTWKRSRSAGCIPNDLFDQVHSALVSQLLDRGMQIRVLVAAIRPAVVLAWVAFEPDRRGDGVIVHYAYTREGFRERGYARFLLDDIGAGKKFIYTHQTGAGAQCWPEAKHNPGIARRKTL